MTFSEYVQELKYSIHAQAGIDARGDTLTFPSGNTARLTVHATRMSSPFLATTFDLTRAGELDPILRATSRGLPNELLAPLTTKLLLAADELCPRSNARIGRASRLGPASRMLGAVGVAAEQLVLGGWDVRFPEDGELPSDDVQASLPNVDLRTAPNGCIIVSERADSERDVALDFDPKHWTDDAAGRLTARVCTTLADTLLRLDDAHADHIARILAAANVDSTDVFSVSKPTKRQKQRQEELRRCVRRALPEITEVIRRELHR